MSTAPSLLDRIDLFIRIRARKLNKRLTRRFRAVFDHDVSERCITTDGFTYGTSDRRVVDAFAELDTDTAINAFTVVHRFAPTDLVKLFDHYGSDKGTVALDHGPGAAYPWTAHTYGHFYDQLFRPMRSTTRLLFECGLGTSSPQFGANMGVKGKPGASLRAWRDFFPNAHIHGADIDRDCLFQEERITTAYVDQTDPAAINAMWEGLALRDLDIIIDDGLHTFSAGSTLFTHSFHRLRQGGVYVIEDIVSGELPQYHRFFADQQINYQLVAGLRSVHTDKGPARRIKDNNFIVVVR